MARGGKGCSSRVDLRIVDLLRHRLHRRLSTFLPVFLFWIRLHAAVHSAYSCRYAFTATECYECLLWTAPSRRSCGGPQDEWPPLKSFRTRNCEKLRYSDGEAGMVLHIGGFRKMVHIPTGVEKHNECVNAPLSFGGAMGIGRSPQHIGSLFESNYRIGCLSDAHVMFAVVEWSVQLVGSRQYNWFDFDIFKQETRSR